MATRPQYCHSIAIHHFKIVDKDLQWLSKNVRADTKQTNSCYHVDAAIRGNRAKSVVKDFKIKLSASFITQKTAVFF